MGQTKCTITCDGSTIEEIENFAYKSDALSVSEDATFTVINKKHQYRDTLPEGAKIEFILQNDNVNGGSPTVKHRGRITKKSIRLSPTGGTMISITSSDPGHHLQVSDAPLWFRLQGRTYADLVDPTVFSLGKDGTKKYFIDPSWGIKQVRFDGDSRRRLKLGLAAAVLYANKDVTPVAVIQVEPGEKVADLITSYSRRINRFLGMSPDGETLCIFSPNDRAKPLYSLRIRDNDAGNNILDVSSETDTKSLYTLVEVVGEPVGFQESDPASPNGRKKRGAVTSESLPYRQAKTVFDGECFERSLAEKQAKWLMQQGLFNSWYASYTVAEHHQNGYWWESDQTSNVSDDELGIEGNLYVSQVLCSGSKTGADTTQVIVRRPGLLSAAYGEIPNPPVIRGSGVKDPPVKGR